MDLASPASRPVPGESRPVSVEQEPPRSQHKDERAPFVPSKPALLKTPSEFVSDSIDEHPPKASNVVGNEGNSGRWTAEEHRRFLAAARQHGRRWKKISKSVRTRTPTQVRTHALKYYTKLAKSRKDEEGDLDLDDAEPPRPYSVGRWKGEEHRLFLTGVLLHGKDWKKVSARIGTRSPVQVRTHAQKFYAKVAKARRIKEVDEVASDEEAAAVVPSSVPSPGHLAAPEPSGGEESEVVADVPSSVHSVSPEPPVVHEATASDADVSINAGRWTAQEHRRFLTAALAHGRDWQKISRSVGTRTAVQVRTHAQKYLERWMRQRLQSMT